MSGLLRTTLGHNADHSMKIKRSTALSTLFSITLTFSGQIQAITDQQYLSIKTLGQLNATALNCEHHEEVRRIKKALIVNLPKRRQLGEEFERITNDSFLSILQQEQECPEANSLANSISDAIKQLESAFKK